MTGTLLILDTSAINKLADDPEFEALLAGARTTFFVRMTETSIAEVQAFEKKQGAEDDEQYSAHHAGPNAMQPDVDTGPSA